MGERLVAAWLRARPRSNQQLDGISQVLVGDVMIATLEAQRERLHQDIDVAEALRRFEFVARELDSGRSDREDRWNP